MHERLLVLGAARSPPQAKHPGRAARGPAGLHHATRRSAGGKVCSVLKLNGHEGGARAILATAQQVVE
jgi:hypothetical protein